MNSVHRRDQPPAALPRERVTASDYACSEPLAVRTDSTVISSTGSGLQRARRKGAIGRGKKLPCARVSGADGVTTAVDHDAFIPPHTREFEGGTHSR